MACAGVTPSVTITPFTAVHLHIHQDKVSSRGAVSLTPVFVRHVLGLSLT